MEIKHYVITRFLSLPNLGLGDKIFDEEIIKNGISYAENYFVPSLNNQTVKDFTVIFMINENHDTKNSSIRKLYDMKLDMPFYVMPQNEYFKFIERDSEGADWVILTRMDYDDLINYKAVETIQVLTMAKDNICDIFSYGYNTGTILLNNKLYPFTKPSYSNQGYFSIFESLCVKRKYLTSKLNIYNFPHTQIKSKVRKYAEDNKLVSCEIPEDEFRVVHENFVWVRHENTGTELLRGASVVNRKLLYEVSIDPSAFKKLFGINL